MPAAGRLPLLPQTWAKVFIWGEDARPRSAVPCQEADVLSKQDISGVADAEICGFFVPGGVSPPVAAQVHSWKTTVK